MFNRHNLSDVRLTQLISVAEMEIVLLRGVGDDDDTLGGPRFGINTLDRDTIV
jgi:hypothetical protein